MLPPYPHSRPEPYHRILRTWTFRWWKPLLGIGVVAIIGLLLAPVVVMAAVGLGLEMFARGGVGSYPQDLVDLRVTPPVLLTVNLSLAALIPVTFVTIRLIHRMRPRWLGSVRPGLRWGLFVQYFVIAVLATVAFTLVIGVFTGQTTVDGGDAEPTDQSTRAAFLLVILLTSPLQSAAEEYAFRGYLLQAFGALVRGPWFTLVVTSLLFAVAHGSQNLPLFADRFLFGLLAGALVIYTGGLEAGIALHIVNNVVVLGLSALSGGVSATLNTSEASWLLLVVDIGQLATFGVLVVLWTRWRRVRRLTLGPPSAG